VHPVAASNQSFRASESAHVVAVIPARYASIRLPAKPLADIAGHPMIEHVYRRAADARGVAQVIVATDDRRIADAVRAFGGTVQMTRPDHRTGTDRLAEVAATLTCDIVVNVQGDLPLLDSGAIEDAVGPLVADDALQMSTLCTPIVDDADYHNPNVVKVVRAGNGDALYFSRSPIPFFRAGRATSAGPAEAGHDISDVAPGFSRALKHIGLYAYRRTFVGVFAALPPTPLETAESLEQLRALEHGYRIHAVLSHVESIEVDTPEDLERVRRLMAVTART
jgi:3-deoxy-manno-octulosonate cytidylyltransferase (CMP-KDO synthetase)